MIGSANEGLTWWGKKKQAKMRKKYFTDITSITGAMGWGEIEHEEGFPYFASFSAWGWYLKYAFSPFALLFLFCEFPLCLEQFFCRQGNSSFSPSPSSCSFRFLLTELGRQMRERGGVQIRVDRQWGRPGWRCCS